MTASNPTFSFRDLFFSRRGIVPGPANWRRSYQLIATA